MLAKCESGHETVSVDRPGAASPTRRSHGPHQERNPTPLVPPHPRERPYVPETNQTPPGPHKAPPQPAPPHETQTSMNSEPTTTHPAHPEEKEHGTTQAQHQKARAPKPPRTQRPRRRWSHHPIWRPTQDHPPSLCKASLTPETCDRTRPNCSGSQGAKVSEDGLSGFGGFSHARPPCGPMPTRKRRGTEQVGHLQLQLVEFILEIDELFLSSTSLTGSGQEGRGLWPGV